MTRRIGAAFGILLLAALGGCDDARTAKEMVASDFPDPASAQWRNVQVVDAATGEQWVCGEVNAKNLMGAYTGYRGFVANVKQSLVILEPGAEFVASPLNAPLAAGNYRLARSFCRG
jgi:hypothetical protein